MNEKQQLYYLQNGYVGNAVLWWAKDKCGYTTDLSKAGKYTKEECQAIIRLGDRPERAWPVEHIDKHPVAKIVTVDAQYLDRKHSRRWLPGWRPGRPAKARRAPEHDPDLYDVFDCSAT